MSQRTRTQNKPTIMSDLGRYWSNGVLQESPTYGPYPVYKYTKTFTDVVTPDFRRKMADGEIINNPCDLEINEYVHTGHMVEQTWTHGSPEQHGRNTTGNFYEHLWSFSAETRNRDEAYSDFEKSRRLAKFKCLSNVDDTPYAFLEDIAEIRETIRFLRRPLASISNLAYQFRRAVKKRQAETSLSVAQAIADVWLSYRFGFSPLLRSALDLVEIYNGSRAKRRSKRLVARGFASTSGATLENHSFNSTYEWDSTLIWDGKQKAYILYEVSNPMADWSFHLGVRPHEIPETIWAILPYSFMVDRVVDISSALSGLRALSSPNVTMLAAGLVSKERADIEYRNLTWDNPDNTTSYLSASSLDDRSFHYTRSLWAPSIQDAIPPVEFGGLVDSATNVIDLLSLTLSNLRIK